MTPKLFPVEPLLALLPPEPSLSLIQESRGRGNLPAPGSAADIATRIGVARETVSRWRKGQHVVKEDTADRVACALGLHPGLIWPEWWDVEDADRWHSCTEPGCDCNPKALVAS